VSANAPVAKQIANYVIAKTALARDVSVNKKNILKFKK
jgi:hypothetical protein